MLMFAQSLTPFGPTEPGPGSDRGLEEGASSVHLRPPDVGKWHF